MDITPKLSSSAYVVRGYGPDVARVGDADFAYPLCMYEHGACTLDNAALSEDAAAQLLAILPPSIELLIVGTGARMQHVPEAVKATLRARNLRTETMDSGAAFRTYNVLMAEGRRVALWVLAPIS